MKEKSRDRKGRIHFSSKQKKKIIHEKTEVGTASSYSKMISWSKGAHQKMKEHLIKHQCRFMQLNCKKLGLQTGNPQDR